MVYYRLDVVENNETVSVLTTKNYVDACQQYDVWKSFGKVVSLYQVNTDTVVI